MNEREKFEKFITDFLSKSYDRRTYFFGLDEAGEYIDVKTYKDFFVWQACAKQKDKEILGLQKQCNAYKMLNESIHKNIDCHVSEGVAFKTKELESEINQLDSEREANQLLTNEIEKLKRGEFICKKCGLRKDSEPREVDF